MVLSIFSVRGSNWSVLPSSCHWQVCSPLSYPISCCRSRNTGRREGVKSKDKLRQQDKQHESRDHKMVSALYSHDFWQAPSYPNDKVVDREAEEAGDGPGQDGAPNYNPYGRIRSHFAARVARPACSMAQSQSCSKREEMPEDIGRHFKEAKTENKEEQESQGRDLKHV